MTLWGLTINGLSQRQLVNLSRVWNLKIISFQRNNKNMDFTEIINEVKSGVVHFLFLSPEGKKVASGSGFLCAQKVVTCDHVIMQSYPLGTKVHLRFDDSHSENLDGDLVFTIEDLRRKIKARSAEVDNDFCLLEIDGIDYSMRYNFEIGKVENDARVGTEILFMGYPFDHRNLVSHRGYISSIYRRNGILTVQLDASINASNSGGPLIDPYTKKVLGIITRKETSLSKDFENLIKILRDNILSLSNSDGGSVTLMGIDIRQAFLGVEKQMEIVAINMRRSANAGIGFAFDLSALINEL